MKTTIAILAVSSLTLGFVSCSGGGIEHGNTSSAANSKEQSIEGKVIQQTNALRASKGLGPVKLHKGLSSMARKHSDFMAINSGKFGVVGKTISHQGFEGRVAQASRIYNLESLGENVGSTPNQTDPATSMMQSWITSPIHYNTLVGKTYTKIGVGVRESNGRYYMTMLKALPSAGKLPPFVGPGNF